MDTILGFLGGIWPTLRAALKVLISLGGLLAAIWSVLAQFADIPAALTALSVKIDSLTGLISSLPTDAIMNRVNTIFPLTEFLGLVSGYMLIVVSALIIRWIKAIYLCWSGG